MREVIDNPSDLNPFYRTLMVLMLSIGCNRTLNKKDIVLRECSVIIMGSLSKHRVSEGVTQQNEVDYHD